MLEQTNPKNKETWRTFRPRIKIFSPSPSPATPSQRRCAPPRVPPPPPRNPPPLSLFPNKSTPPFRLGLFLPFPAPETEEKIKNIPNICQGGSSELVVLVDFSGPTGPAKSQDWSAQALKGRHAQTSCPPSSPEAYL